VRVQTLCALSPNNSEVHIYAVGSGGSKWERQAVLKVISNPSARFD
jgi:hypothetical protein